jgi:H+-translocating NAD(P) transhydrogenase subunit alpha
MNSRYAYSVAAICLGLFVMLGFGRVLVADVQSQAGAGDPPAVTSGADLVTYQDDVAASKEKEFRTTILMGSLTVFLLAIFVGVEVITKVPPTLHTPLMSGSNAISGITIVGAILVAGNTSGGWGTWLGAIAIVLAMINVVGGFLVTHRMLMMFKKR